MAPARTVSFEKPQVKMEGKKMKVTQYWNKCSLSNRNVLEDGLVWKAKLCAKLPKPKQK